MRRGTSELTPHLSAQHFFGAELRHRREAAGLSLAGLARQVLTARSMVGEVEVARRFPSADLAARCDDVLDAGGVLVRLQAFAAAERLAPPQGRSALAPKDAAALRRLLDAVSPSTHNGADTVPAVLDRIDRTLANTEWTERGVPDLRRHGGSSSLATS